MGPGSTLQDNQATSHRGQVITDFLQQQENLRMDWPAYCSDLAPIEHVLDILGGRVAKKKVKIVLFR